MLMLLSGWAGLICARDNGAHQQWICGRLVPAAEVGRLFGVATDPAVQTFQRLGHSFPGQSAHVYRLGLPEKFSDISCGNCVFFQACFKPCKTESCQH
jgi:hypothetical protein